MQGFNYPLGSQQQENYNSYGSIGQKNVLSSINRQSPLSNMNTNINQAFNFNSQGQNLEQENLALKSKVELLQNLLLGICKDQNIDHPLLQQLAKNPKFSLDFSALQPQKCKSPKDILFSKSNQKKENRQQMVFKSTEKEKTVIISTRESNLSCSPIKSTQRRKRSQRERNVFNQNQSLSQRSKTKIDIYEELPLQMEGRISYVPKQSEIDRTQVNQTSEFHFDGHQTPSEGTFFNDTNLQQQHPAQIQLKYVKMLEELEQQSQIEKLSSKEYNDFNKTATMLLKELQQDLASSTRSLHTKNKNSSHFEHKQYYENELTSLKNELTQFEQQEEKLLKIIEKKSHNGNTLSQTYVLDFEKTPIKVQESKDVCILEADSVQDQEEVDVDSYCRYEDVTENPKIVEMSQTQDEMMKNIFEEHNHMKDRSDSSFEVLIKPVKISSPLNRLNLRESDFIQEEEDTVLRITPRELIQVQSQDIITPIRSYEQIIKEEVKVPQTKSKQVCNYPAQTPTKMVIKKNINQASVPESSIKNTSDKKNNVSRLRKQISDTKKNTQKFQIQNIISKIEQNPTHSPFRFMIRGNSKGQSKGSTVQLDQISKTSALANGLTQQEEPIEEETLVDLAINIKKTREEIAQMKKMSDEEYFGIYSREKGEEIKSQRSQSIKRCEDLLQSLLQYEKSFKRPEFLNVYAPIRLQKYQTQQVNNSYGGNLDQNENYNTQFMPQKNHEEMLQEQIEIASSNIAESINEQERKSQQELPQIEIDDKKTEDNSDLVSEMNKEQDEEVAHINSVQMHSKQSSNQGLINIEVPHSNMFNHHPSHSSQETPNPEQLPFVQQQKQEQISQLVTLTSCENEDQSTKETPVLDHLKYLEIEKYSQQLEQQQQFREKKNSLETGCLQPRIINKATPMNRERSYRERSSQKPSPFYGNTTPIPNNCDNSEISPFQYEKTLRMGDSTRLSICKNNKDIYIYNPGNIDLEMLYDRKSRSVLKKRDELLKQKEMKNKKKLEEKYQRIENLRNERQKAHSQRKQLSKSKSAQKLIDRSTHERASISSIDNYKDLRCNIDQIRVKEMPKKLSSTSQFSKATKSSFTGTSQHSNMSLNNTQKNSQISSECGSHRIKNDGLHNLGGQKKQHDIFGYMKKDQQLLNQVIAHRQQRIYMKHGKQELDNQFLQKNQSNVVFPTQFEKTSHMSRLLNSTRTREEESKQKRRSKHNYLPQSVIPEKTSKKTLTKSKSVIKKKLNSTNKSASKLESQFTTKISQVIVSAEEERCENCERLIQKGISTDFCLKHL